MFGSAIMGQKYSIDRSRQIRFIDPLLERASLKSVGGNRNPRNNSGSKHGKRHVQKVGGKRNKLHSLRHHPNHETDISRMGISETAYPYRLDLLLDMPRASIKTQQQHGWNAQDRSGNVYVKGDDDLIMHRHPVAQSTDGIRAKVGYSRGLHCWEITWNTKQRGTHAMVGVCTADAPLTCNGYHSLIGQNCNSWGWDLVRNRVICGNKSKIEKKKYPINFEGDEPFEAPEKIVVALDMDEGTLSFVANGKYLGIAFTGLKGKTLYPAVSSVWGHCEIEIRYLNGLEPTPLPLSELCRRQVRIALGSKHLEQATNLPLPPLLQNYILYR